MIKNRLEKNLKKLKGWVHQQNLDAYRIYDLDIPEYPYLIDHYKDHILIYFRKSKIDLEPEKQQNFKDTILALEELFPNHRLVIKERVPQKGNQQYARIKKKPNRFPVNEGPAQFLVDLETYLDTGLFLDHRPLRQWIHKESQNKKFLNLFCYTGAVSVMAALGGAKTTSVDLSGTYLEWAKENFKLNNINPDRHNFIEKSALEYLRVLDREKFDLIFLDPPTFSNSKKMTEAFEVEKDQLFLVEKCMRKLSPKGVLYFSNNKRDFKLAPEISEKYKVVNKTLPSIPKDFRDSKIHHCFKITFKP